LAQLHVKNALHLEGLLSDSQSEVAREALSEDAFRRMIAIERKRTERTNEPFLLMLLQRVNRENPGDGTPVLDALMTALLSATRETDVIGWYRQNHTIGLLFTGLAADEKNISLDAIVSRVNVAIQSELTLEQSSEITISLHIFPDEWNQDDFGGPSNPVLYPDLHETVKVKRVESSLKRPIDILGSSLLLILCLPLLTVIGIAVKLTSKGPVFFRQKRVGQYGRHFTFLKFRSMRDRNDHSAHQQYVTQMITGNAERVAHQGNSEGVYKLANDPRITPLGKFLRKTSLDELPQLINVLRGEMSLVGPRPPIPYEVAAYQTWHRRRLLQVKPGITGLWQVTGRSQVSFDEMVRLDLQYATFWSLWLDIKILIRTPAAVIKGAY
jgi:lipopolysaccharide/colanic/teichoic acid biosynthesis glycosyltransferase/Arc/MetJ-type ribon-helix-helix transcriptional regulator